MALTPSGLAAPGPVPHEPERDPQPLQVETAPGSAVSPPLYLSKFYAALHGLASGNRNRHVRVLWFGDSHTAADFMTDAVRRPLQLRFGEGGPGFLQLGIKNYHHGLASVQSRGNWRRVPASPATTRLHAGVYGLAGVGASPRNAEASVSLELGSGAAWARGAVHWDFVYRLPHSDSRFTISGAAPKPELLSRNSGLLRPSGLASFSVTTQGEPLLVLNGFAAEPELFGVFVESAAPGVVVDTLGINGARIGTPLAWSQEPWLAEVKARAPALAVLSYGTNEVGDNVPVSEYRQAYAELVARLRSAGDMDCLILGPTERLRGDWTTYPRVMELDDAQRRIAQELSCGFFSLLGAMGGPGSYRTWAFRVPPLARRDRVHLRPAGYRLLGAALAEQLLASYSALYPEGEGAK